MGEGVTRETRGERGRGLKVSEERARGNEGDLSSVRSLGPGCGGTGRGCDAGGGEQHGRLVQPVRPLRRHRGSSTHTPQVPSGMLQDTNRSATPRCLGVCYDQVTAPQRKARSGARPLARCLVQVPPKANPRPHAVLSAPVPLP